MSGALHLTVDSRAVSLRASIRACFATDVRIVMLTDRAACDLARELGGAEQSAAFLVRLCKRFKKPCAVNALNPDGSGSSRTIIFSPPDWTQERLAGYVGALHSELEDMFGEISHLETPERTAGGAD